MEHLQKCSCGKYTLEPRCHGATQRPLPPKFSLEDKYGKYRREIKRKELGEKGLY